MRVVVLGSAALTAALFATRPVPAASVFPWCYYGNEDIHCTEVSFEMCHFGTLGNGGYCFRNPYYPRPVQGNNRWYGNSWYPVEYVYPSYLERQQMGYREHEQRVVTGPGFGWCYGWVGCHTPAFQTYPFGGVGYGGYWYDNPWYFGGSYRWGPRFAYHPRHHHVSREAIASATEDHQPHDQPDAQSATHEAESGEPLLAFASADPQLMTNLGGRSSRTEQFITPPAKNRSRNSVPTINVVPSCRGGAAVGFDKSVDVCLAQEMSARDQLANEWERFSSADRSSCTSVATIGGGGSYTGLLSCLEMKRDARNLRAGERSGSPVALKTIGRLEYRSQELLRRIDDLLAKSPLKP